MQKRNIGIGTLNIGNQAKKQIIKILDNNRLSYGPITNKFENKFAKLHNSKFAIYTVSGTAALQISLHAMKSIHGWKDNDEVIVPAITFIATSNIVLQNKMKPIFVDVNKETYNIDITKIEQKITKKTRAIIPVHLFGLPADMDEIKKIAQKYKLKIIEDSCETMLVKYKNKSVGTIGDIGCFSTYVAHIITTGVGGIAITNNPQYAIKIKSLMNHGRDSIYLNIDDDNNLSNKNSFKIIDRRFSFTDVGYSYRLTEMEAALGLEQLNKIKSIINNRHKNARYLIEGLKKYKHFLQLPKILKDRGHSFLGFPILIISKKIKRNDLILYLERNGIETRYLMPLLNQPIYKKMFGNIEKQYPIAKYINNNGFYIGCHQDLKKQDLDYIIYIFNKYLEKI